MPKGTSSAEAMLNSEKIKYVTLSVTKLCLSQGISQSVTQSVTHYICIETLLNKNNLLKAFCTDLKACLGLVLPNQYCPIIIWESEAGFLGDIMSWAMPTLSSSPTMNH